MSDSASLDLPDFTGKLLLIYVSGQSTEDALLIHFNSFETQAGRMFVTGRVSHTGEEGYWSRDLTASIAWDRVDSYLVYDSFEQYDSRMKEWRAVKARKNNFPTT